MARSLLRLLDSARGGVCVLVCGGRGLRALQLRRHHVARLQHCENKFKSNYAQLSAQWVPSTVECSPRARAGTFYGVIIPAAPKDGFGTGRRDRSPRFLCGPSMPVGRGKEIRPPGSAVKLGNVRSPRREAAGAAPPSSSSLRAGNSHVTCLRVAAR
ncbi:hypothetical protein NDU88_005403 [Pleurodeles waltl]|uniref:Uncharacterized protein n=1 Tax=Pleurodeles waltl TaxID=8319 RepID=A0AAV7SLP2_PLEWA|nr:hypothetical protein NDU88_005403 [Pleurodeles waltl]